MSDNRGPVLYLCDDEPSSLTDRSILDEDYLPLSRKAMQQVGEAAQTLGAMLYITHSETYISVPKLAEIACVGIRTCRRHLDKLVGGGWIVRGKRGQTLSGRPRRTPTYRITKQTLDGKKPYATLPRWAARMLPTWKERCVIALIVSRHMLIVRKTEDQHENAGIEERTRYSLRKLIEDSGLCRQSVIDAKRELTRRRLIMVEPSDFTKGEGDVIGLNDEYQLDPSWTCHARRKSVPSPSPEMTYVPSICVPHAV
jgi:predicted ArsR family transcriptional regulator